MKKTGLLLVTVFLMGFVQGHGQTSRQRADSLVAAFIPKWDSTNSYHGPKFWYPYAVYFCLDTADEIAVDSEDPESAKVSGAYLYFVSSYRSDINEAGPEIVLAVSRTRDSVWTVDGSPEFDVSDFVKRWYMYHVYYLNGEHEQSCPKSEADRIVVDYFGEEYGEGCAYPYTLYANPDSAAQVFWCVYRENDSMLTASWSINCFGYFLEEEISDSLRYTMILVTKEVCEAATAFLWDYPPINLDEWGVVYAHAGSVSAEYRTESGDCPMLFPNRPNPFGSGTRIPYRIPATAASARVILYDRQGRRVLEKEVRERPRGELLLDLSGEMPGLYFCVLEVEGKTVDVRRIVKVF